jgi:hypothetical protein
MTDPQEEYELCLEYFDTSVLDTAKLFLVLGNSNSDTFGIVKLFLEYKPMTAVICKNVQKYTDCGINSTQVFNRYSSLLKKKIFLKDKETSIIFDDILYNKSQILDFYNSLPNSNVSLLQIQENVEENIIFDCIFISSTLQHSEIEKIVKNYCLPCSASDLSDIINTCIESKEFCIIYKSSFYFLENGQSQ